MSKKTNTPTYPQLELRKLSSLKAHPDGLRSALPEDEFKLGKSLKHFGFLRTSFVVNNRTGILLDGDRMLRPAREAGLEEVPVWVVDIAPEDEDVAHLALNNHVGEWKWYHVANILKSIRDRGIDAALTGFAEWVIKPMLGANWRPGVLGSPGAEDPKQVKLI